MPSLPNLLHDLKDYIFRSRQGIKDLVVSMASSLATASLGLITSVLVARSLGPREMGRYALVLSVSTAVLSLSNLGINQTAIRFAAMAVARDDTSGQMAVLRWAFRLRVLIVLGLCGLTFAIAPYISLHLWHDTNLAYLIRISMLTCVFSAVGSIPTIYFQSVRLFTMNAVVVVSQSLVSILGIALIAANREWSIERVVQVSVVSTGLGAFAFLLLVPYESFIDWRELKQPWSRLLEGIWRVPGEEQKKLASHLDPTSPQMFGFYLLLSSVICTLLISADVWMMGNFVDKNQIGLYSVAMRLTGPLVIALGALNTVLWPRASGLTSAHEIRIQLGRTIRLGALAAIGCSIYSIFGPLAISFLFGPAYRNSVFLSQLLCIRYSIAIFTGSVGVIGYSFGMARRYWWINSLQLATVLFVNYLLLPRIGVIGAAIALILSEVIGLSLVGSFIWNRYKHLEERHA